MTDADRFARRFDVSRETLERLDTYSALLRKWNPRINLVSAATLDDLWSRHFRDSAQLFGLAPLDARRWVDLGSGGGFPGLVVALLAQDRRPDMSVTLIESDGRKAAFLRAVARDTGIAPTILADRIEAVPPLRGDVVSARALAPLPRLLPLALRHLADDGLCLFPKGARYRAEVAESLESWAFDCEEYPSETDAEAVILKIGGIGRV